jgi:hypothetical protein
MNPNSYQNPIPQMPMTADQHRKSMNMALIAGAIVIIFGMLYWWTTVNQAPTPSTATQIQDIRAQVAEALRNAPPASQQQIMSVTSQLSAAKTTVTAAQKQAVANALQEK